MSKDDIFFKLPSEAAVTELLLKHPFVWVVSSDAEDYRATSVPVTVVLDDAGHVCRFTGHFARANEHVKLLRRQPRALMLFQGTNGYVSPSWLSDRTQAPTWYYVNAQFTVDIEFLEDAAELADAMGELVTQLEAGREHAWQLHEMGERYAGLARGIIGFRATIRSRRVKFKLGQDERKDIYPMIFEAVSSRHEELARLMELCNPGRA